MSSMNLTTLKLSDVSWDCFAQEGSEEWGMMVLVARDESTVNASGDAPENLHDGLDEADGIYYIVTDYETKKVSYEEAFKYGVNLSCKMAELGPKKNETEEQFNDELFRIIKVFYSDYTSLPDELLTYAIFKSKEALDKCTRTFIGNHMMQTMCDFTKELQSRNNYEAAKGMFRFCKERLFEIYYESEKYYDNIVEGFYISTKADESMPPMFYDRSYPTDENVYFPDVYYLKMTDYYAELVITAADKGMIGGSVKEMREFHDEYTKFMESVQLKNQKMRTKIIKRICRDGLKKIHTKENSKKRFLQTNPSLAYAAAKQVGDYGLIKKAIRVFPKLTIKDSDLYFDDNTDALKKENSKGHTFINALFGIAITFLMIVFMVAPLAYLIKMGHMIFAVLLFVGCVLGYIRGKDELWKSTITNDAIAIVAITLLRAGHPYYSGIVLSGYAIIGWVMMH